MQTNKPDKKIEVLIVGAGPAGLMMACQLALHHISFRIIDKKDHPTSNSGALIIHSRSIEILNQMGIAQKVIREGIIAKNINIIFNGKPLIKIPLKNVGSGLTKFPYFLMVEQSKTEHLLNQFIKDFGYDIERGTELTYFKNDADGVTSIIKNKEGNEESLKTRYIIGADGSQSFVRKQLNISFRGKAHSKSLFIIDCDAETNLLSDEIHFSFSNKTINGFFPLSNGKWRIDGTIPKELESLGTITFNDVEKHFSERIRMNTKIFNPDWFSVFHSYQRYASTFQQNHSFLIGDASHIHSPIGAQGMNTGMQDAFNLGWKLAFVIKGLASPRLFDTYTTERLPIAKKNIHATDTLFNLLTNDYFAIKALRIHLFPFLIKNLLPLFCTSKRFCQHFFKSISEINIHYRKSFLSHHTSINLSPFYKPRPGDRLPFILYYDKGKEVNIQEKITGTTFHLFIFTNDNPSLEIINMIEKYHNLLSYEIINYSSINHHLFKRLGIKKNGFFLIRPDLHIAFLSNNPKTEKLENYFHILKGS